uniref:Uncharacterized protein n=1 Tax=Vertebrata isogona TaxID=2006944 RepID=A0A1Z1MFM5_9FLOR|nr:hypothetical protein [Vertebrata isogona]ARW64571.1 hypothetical protein [Vertebrata isogona]
MIFYNIKIKTICIISIKKTQQLPSIPIKMTALYGGSHTKLIQYKVNSTTNIESLQRNTSNVEKKKLRYVWLKNSLYTNITFARSLWNLIDQNNIIKKMKNNNPLGLSLIKHQIDINKNVHELYYCYCKEFENILQIKKPIWGRKYTIVNSNNYNIIIQEFFSPDIVL